jgi:plastocyanin
MNKNIVIGLVVVLIVLAGGFMYYQSTQNKAPQSPTPASESKNNMKMEKVTTAPTTTEAASPSAGAESTSSKIKEFTVTGKNFSFTPNTLAVNKGDKVKITFKNAGGFHDFKIDEFNVAAKKIGDGQQDVVEFTADKAGTFEYYCSVGNHRQMGMKGTLTVN